MPFFLRSKVSGLSGEISGYIFWGIIEKEKLYCGDIKHFMGSAPCMETRKRKALATGISNIHWLFVMTNTNMQSSKVVFTFSFFNQKYHFWANLVKKIEIVSLSWHLLPRLIRIYWIQWWCWLIFDQKYSFWANLVQKIKIVTLRWNLVSRYIQKCRI